ncbi:hypothetical protein [Neobacillus bataviensis]|uniref:hypothetical protein n=1 Tax=Neobacillus bataviensis TaxID=220685 RepID=UPI001CBB7377|nr:hypothetical protein [Neobacillus bataviensis]
MFKIFLFGILILLIILFHFIILIKNRNQATQIYTIHTFLGSSPNNVPEDEQIEQKKSLIDGINDFFKESKEKIIDDENEDSDGDGNDIGE